MYNYRHKYSYSYNTQVTEINTATDINTQIILLAYLFLVIKPPSIAHTHPITVLS